MVSLDNEIQGRKVPKKRNVNGPIEYKKLSSIGEMSKGIINELSSPIDATNRFINLALQVIGDNHQGRQFLLESKEGIRKTSILLKRLNDYAEKMERELREISSKNEQYVESPPTTPK